MSGVDEDDTNYYYYYYSLKAFFLLLLAPVQYCSLDFWLMRRINLSETNLLLFLYLEQLDLIPNESENSFHYEGKI